jgi:hypothetical protein
LAVFVDPILGKLARLDVFQHCLHRVANPLVDGRPEYEIRAATPEDGPARTLYRLPASRVPVWQVVNIWEASDAFRDVIFNQTVAEEMARQALALASEVQDQQSLWSAQYRLAQIALAQGQKQTAVEHLEAAVKAVEAVSGNIKIDIFKMGFLENKLHVFDELIALLAPVDPAKLSPAALKVATNLITATTTQVLAEALAIRFAAPGIIRNPHVIADGRFAI